MITKLLTALLIGSETIVFSKFISVIITQPDILAWSATITACVSGICLAMLPIYQKWRQTKRAEDVLDDATCRSKLDEAIARIRSLELSIVELTNQVKEWESLYNALKQNIIISPNTGTIGVKEVSKNETIQ